MRGKRVLTLLHQLPTRRPLPQGAVTQAQLARIHSMLESRDILRGGGLHGFFLCFVTGFVSLLETLWLETVSTCIKIYPEDLPLTLLWLTQYI